MTAFHTIAIPHDDILKGRLTMDVFAADLWDVFKDRGSEEYKNADLFFQKTYQTDGLKTLLEVVKSRLDGTGGDPVLQLQTPFGGGKTHTLIAMYHHAKEWGVKRVVMVGTAMSATDTLWGMLEEQLTGSKKNFNTLTSPGRTDQFRELLESQGPVLILFDELLEYITKAAGVQVVESTLAAQTIAFMQELTELVSTMEKVVLVVTLPSSLLEHFDTRAEQLFQQLQRVSGRVEKIYTPVQENEITQVIRCRLFSRVNKKAASKQIAAFMDYAERESLLPAGVEASEYRQRFEASYPFIPDVVDILYQRWGSYSTFQRTRGVLRLLALIVHILKDKNIPYITLADFNLANQEIRRELLKHIGAEFDSVIAADITGEDAGSRKVSTSLGKAYQGLKLGERVTTTTFMYSFSGGVERGATLADIKRNATTLENPSAVVAEAVEELKSRLFYIQNQSGKYFFLNQANLNRLLLNRMENIHDSEVQEVEESLLKNRIRGDRLKVFVWRSQTSDIPETPDLKLIVFSEPNETLMRSMLDQKGNTPRVHRNTLFFLVPIASEKVSFSNLVRKHLAYESLSTDPTLKLTADQIKEIKDRIKRLSGDLSESVRRLYRQLYLPARTGWKEVDLGLPTVGDTKMIDQEVYDRLRTEGEILEKVAPLVIKEKFLKEHDWASTSQIFQASLKTPGEARALNQAAWDTGIAEGVRKGLFGLGELKDEQPISNYFKEETTASFSEGEILIKADICEAQRQDSSGGDKFPQDPPPPGGGVGDHPDFLKPPFIPPGKTTTEGKYQQLKLNFVVPKGKVASLMGVLNYLQSKYDRVELSLNVGEGQLTEQEYEDKVKEAFRQMGIDIG
ncbi:ATP-binding protein [Chloroflexota bacterium]